MAHPYNSVRNNFVQKSRVPTLTKGYAKGGAVSHGDEAEDARLIRQKVKASALKMAGGAVKQRADKRARGGKVKRADAGAVKTPKPAQKPERLADEPTPWGASFSPTVDPSKWAKPLSERARGGGARGGNPRTPGIAESAGKSASRDAPRTKNTLSAVREEDEGRGRARGGRTGKDRTIGPHKAKSNVNIVIHPHPGGMAAPPMAMAGGLPPPVIPPRPAVPPPMPPAMPPPGVGGPGMGPPGMMPPGIRQAGGRTYAKGGRVADGPAWKEGLKTGTSVQHSPGKGDTSDISRPKQRTATTFAKGGAVESSKGGIPSKTDPSTRLPGGSLGGKARLWKEKRAKGRNKPVQGIYSDT